MKKLAVVGTGIAGMSSAYFLKDDYEITVFEKNNYIGGHTNTLYTDDEGEQIPIDSGFMVFNEVTYPYLCKLFEKLKVPYKNTDMSFGVSHRQEDIEYTGSGWNGLFAQRKNLLSLRYWKFLTNIGRFNSEAPKILDDKAYESTTIEEYVKSHKLSDDFYNLFLVPMSSAVWSTPFEDMGKFPAQSLVRFFYNHGFMGLDTQHQWKTVVKGSETYKQLLIKDFKDRIFSDSQVVEIEQLNNKAKITLANGEPQEFDKVVIAAHADEALSMLKNPTTCQFQHLKHFKYQENIATLHTDENVMPKNKGVWSSWNYIIPNDHETYTVYWMNRLQHVSEKNNYFININGDQYIDSSKLLKKIIYHHPMFDFNAVKAQKTMFDMNTEDTPLHFCGSYFRYGFHEDALMSSVLMCNHLLQKEVL